MTGGLPVFFVDSFAVESLADAKQDGKFKTKYGGATMKPTILLADDDENIRKVCGLYLEREGFAAVHAANGKEALEKLENQQVHCAVIDLMMPELDGWALCREIKAYYQMPVLMLSARSQAEDRIKGFQTGTDDYLTKPFHPVELVMRVKSLLKRYDISPPGKIEMESILIDSSKYQVALNGQTYSLPAKQFDLFYTLMSRPGQIFTREQLIEKIWGLHYEGDERAIDHHVKRLRKLFAGHEDVVRIVTVRGLGYKAEAGQA